MQEIIIENYISPLLERGDDWYSWRIPVDLSNRYDLGEGTILQRTIRLIEVLANEYVNAISDEDRIKYIRRIIVDWGGDRGNQDSAIHSYAI